MSLDSVKAVPGKGAAFIRGFLEEPSERLRDRQEAGMKYVEDLGGSISVSYISKLSKMLEYSGVIMKGKRGRNWYVLPDEDKVAELLSDETYGSSVEVELSLQDVLVRSSFAEHLDKRGCVVSSHEDRLPKEAFKLAMERFNRGELEMVFYDPHGKIQYQRPKSTGFKAPKVWKP